MVTLLLKRIELNKNALQAMLFHLNEGGTSNSTHLATLTLGYLGHHAVHMGVACHRGSRMAQHTQRSSGKKHTRKVDRLLTTSHLPAACTKYAKYKSSSLTETPMWWGWTQSPGLEHCRGLYKALAISTRRNTFRKITITGPTSRLYLPGGGSQFFASCLSGLGWKERSMEAFFL